VIGRYRDTVKRRYFRGDAAFANPEIYEFLEAEGMGYVIRLAANRILQEKIGYLLKRPVGRPPLDVRRYYASFSYQAQSWKKPWRVRPRLSGTQASFIRASASSLPTWRGRPSAWWPSTTQRSTAEQWIKEGKGAIKLDAAVMPFLRRQHRPPSAPCARIQPRQPHADAGDAQGGGTVVVDQPAG
jgi:hypothetical protein